ncbi:MAG: S-adenosylmethionine decarboxylase [Megasphaera sp.]|jgi:S-adenosylmethionine decarboxylase|nr:S-adenosylmethionine decarboxylase [Megasphaera sp.]
MNNTLGKHLLIDFYNCKAKFKKPEDLQPLVERAFEITGSSMVAISFCHIDDELTCVAMSGNAHICIHTYPLLSYTAVDIYSFNINFKSSQIMSAFKVNLHSDRIKATSIRRGDFGSIRDMRPKRKSKITTVRRVKNTGARIKKTSTKMLSILRHPQKTRRSRRHNAK